MPSLSLCLSLPSGTALLTNHSSHPKENKNRGVEDGVYVGSYRGQCVALPEVWPASGRRPSVARDMCNQRPKGKPTQCYPHTALGCSVPENKLNLGTKASPLLFASRPSVKAKDGADTIDRRQNSEAYRMNLFALFCTPRTPPFCSPFWHRLHTASLRGVHFPQL